MERLGKYALRGGVAALLLGLGTPSQAGLTFNFTFTPGTSTAAKNAFIAAGNIWSNLLTDNVTLDMTVGTAVLDPGILGQAQSRFADFSYSSFKTALGADITSASDATAVAHLQAGSNFDLVMNLTSDNPNGSGSITPFLDDNNSANNHTLSISTANAKALGLSVADDSVDGCLATCDAFIQFSSTFGFDYDPSDGIGAGLYDFVGVAAHEIGHALGFTSGIDILDYNTPPRGGPFSSNLFTFVNSLDLFRYSDISFANGAIDWSADMRDKYFSIDGGATKGPLFSTGVYHGDGSQTSHWKDDMGIGIMDPTAAPGEALFVSGYDQLALDVIGWNVKVARPLPEPASWAMMIAGFALVGRGMRVRRRSLAAA